MESNYSHASVPRTFRTAQAHYQTYTPTPRGSGNATQQDPHSAECRGEATNSPFIRVSMGDYATTVMTECSQRGLHTTASFIGELTMSLSDDLLSALGYIPIGTAGVSSHSQHINSENIPPLPNEYSPKGLATFRNVASPAPRVSSVLGGTSSQSSLNSIISTATFATALSLFNKGLARRCYDTLKEPPRLGTGPLLMTSRRTAFLGIYALYMEGEKQKFIVNCGSGQNSTAVVEGIQAGHGATNPNLAEVSLLLQQALAKFPDDSYLLWLYGVTLRGQQRLQESISALLDAVKFNPLLWCAWEDLGKEITDVSQLEDVKLNIETAISSEKLPLISLLLRMFSATVYKALELHAEALNEWYVINHGLVALIPQPSVHQPRATTLHDEGSQRARSVPMADDANEGWEDEGKDASPTATLTESYLVAPNSCPIIQQHMAANLAGSGDHTKALAIYRDLHTRWPSRLQGMDEYSHTLFLTGDRLGLSTLAQSVYSLDPFSAQANVAVGNYYAVMRKRDRSVYYFKRAVHIDPTLVSAWTLLGHEYLEVKNPNAAAEAYRAGLRVEKRDYRAWYSLGQIYELHHMYPFALHYFWRTVQIKPHDPRMWQAAAAVLGKLNRTKDMISCLENAEKYEPKNTDNYADIVRTIAQRCLMFDPPQALTYMAKLMACDGRKEDDEVHFLPMLVKFFTAKAKKNSLLLSSRTPGQAEQVAAWLGSASEYLERLKELIELRSASIDPAGNYSPTRGIGGTAAVSGAPPLEQLLHSQSLRIAEYETDIMSVRAALEGTFR